MNLTKGNGDAAHVLIADDNAFVRTALYEFFEREPEFRVCAVAENDAKQLRKLLVCIPT
jgi:DNA-binding NarL/FixJ family response regulator